MEGPYIYGLLTRSKPVRSLDIPDEALLVPAPAVLNGRLLVHRLLTLSTELYG